MMIISAYASSHPDMVALLQFMQAGLVDLFGSCLSHGGLLLGRRGIELSFFFSLEVLNAQRMSETYLFVFFLAFILAYVAPHY